MTWDRTAPFVNNELQHFAEVYSGRTTIDWRDADEELHMSVDIESIVRGRSAAYLIVRSDDGRRWPMFMSELVSFLQNTEGFEYGSSLTCYWTVCKRGQNYGLKWKDKT